MLKKILCLLLALLLCLAVAACKKDPVPEEEPTPDGEEEEEENTLVAEGTFEGSSVTWCIRTDGTLYIGGTGVMPEFHDPTRSPVTPQDSPQPWALFRTGSGGVIRRVVVQNGVTGLASYAFAYCPRIESVSLPESLTSLPESCFAFCTDLSSVLGGVGLVTISDSAFSDCERLSQLELSDALQTVEFGSFTNAAQGADGLMVLFEGGADAWLAHKQVASISQSGNTALLNATAIDPAET